MVILFNSGLINGIVRIIVAYILSFSPMQWIKTSQQQTKISASTHDMYLLPMSVEAYAQL